MKPKLKIRIMANIWRNAATEPPPELYREFENIVYTCSMCTDIDMLAAVLEGMEYRYFSFNIFKAFGIVEFRRKNHHPRHDGAVVLKVEE